MKATALEILSEPLSLLVLLTALTIAVMAPYLHFHQFGEATRMARDAGFSALFTCGGILAVFGTIRTFRREIESGTLAMALVHPITRTEFFLAKTLGALAAYLVFAAIVFQTAAVVVCGAAVGGEIAQRMGGIPRLWGPCFAAGVGVIVLPLAGGAAFNRFGRCRFTLTAFVLALALSALAVVFVLFRQPSLVWRMLPVGLLICIETSVLLGASAAFAVRLKASLAASAAGLVFAALLPVAGNYYLADALTKGGSVSWGYVALAVVALLPAALLFLLWGIHFINGRDVV